MRGGGCLSCLREDNWRPQSSYLPQKPCLLPRCGCEAADAYPASAKTTGGRSRHTCRRRPACCLAVDARQRMTAASTRTGVAVDLPAASTTTGGGRRSACCLAVDARRRMPILPPRRQLEAAVVIPAADALLAASLWMRGGSRPTLPPRRQLEAAVVIPAADALLAASLWMRGGG